jgi:hypothetical protein
MICADNLAQILRVEAHGEFRRTNQIAEHDRKLATFSTLGARWRRRCRLWSGDLPYRLAAAAAEPCARLILEATRWAGNWESRAALSAEAPGPCVFGHAAWAAHQMLPGGNRSVNHT